MVEIAITVAVIVGLVEAIKRTGFLPSKFSALVSIALGMLWYGFTGTESLALNLFAGIVAGLTASGLYSGTKATLR